MPRFEAVIRSARFVYSPYTATEMKDFAQLLADTIRKRIQAGQNIYDQSAAPLKPGSRGRRGYPDYKSARGLQPVRDWTWTGHTLSCMIVKSATENEAIIGFLNERGNTASKGTVGGTLWGNTRSLTAAQIAWLNNKREVQFGQSFRDKAVLIGAFANFHRPLVTLQAAA